MPLNKETKSNQTDTATPVKVTWSVSICESPICGSNRTE